MTDTPLQKLLKEKKPEILALADKYGVYNIRVFGSVARGEDTPESDVDLLVLMEKGRSLTDFCGFRLDVKDLLGCNVDLLEERGLYWFIKPTIMAEAKPL